ncbi:pyruvate formate lyase family protein [uncultured Methanobrevibacter sp.]|uniref:pyruvate formate lyase family protein n=1 Tax=uncultured Methanobrevibacter sp. TaxID=253161 RepID=UPI0025F6026D|nr:pyruvate formate lyase family protein [uncultured Methanobrevibacter sp.]
MNNVTSTIVSLNKYNQFNKIFNYRRNYIRLLRKYKTPRKSASILLKNFSKIYTPSINKTKSNQIKDLFDKIEINISNEGLIFSFDEFKQLSPNNTIIGNISMDYSLILDLSLEDLKLKYQKNDEFSMKQLKVIEAIELLINRTVDKLNSSNRKDKYEYIEYFENIKTKKAKSFKEGLQRILFFNQILWQTGHPLNGLGRLDFILDSLYKTDNLNAEDSLELIKDFLYKIHSYYFEKSNVLLGDTGQIIVLGGLNEDNTYFTNDLTYLFMKALKEIQVPDPKIILRYSSIIPRELMELAIETMITGVGSPLISNDEKVIPNLIEFGYEKADAYNYVVSACWEPAPIRKGLEMNNISSIVYLTPLNELLDNEDLNQLQNFDEFFSKYKEYLIKYVNDVLDEVNAINWECEPLMSLFIENKFNKDISEGSAIYNNYGLTSVSLSNTVNSLYNIKTLVFEDEYSLTELNDARINNFENTSIKQVLKNQKKFGMDDEDIINLTNEITKCASDICDTKTTKHGGKFKFGLSSPDYITGSTNVKASLDGRCDFEPFNVHISFEDNKDYTELMRFASKLEYTDNRFNGNVVDFMVSPDFIKKNFDKFVDFIEISLNMGVFQMQLNVVDSKTLIDAQKHPEKYPNLIVRVWGFSSYFNDLPIEYQNVLIKRALENESKNN